MLEPWAAASRHCSACLRDLAASRSRCFSMIRSTQFTEEGAKTMARAGVLHAPQSKIDLCVRDSTPNPILLMLVSCSRLLEPISAKRYPCLEPMLETQKAVHCCFCLTLEPPLPVKLYFRVCFSLFDSRSLARFPGWPCAPDRCCSRCRV